MSSDRKRFNKSEKHERDYAMKKAKVIAEDPRNYDYSTVRIAKALLATKNKNK